MGIVHLVSLGALATVGMLLVGACNTTYLEQPRDEPQNAADIMRAADLRPRYPQPTATVDTGGASPPKAFSFFGSPAPPPATPQPSGSRGVVALAPAPADRRNLWGRRMSKLQREGYTLNFENAPVSQVAKSVLGDVLGVGYVIDPQVQGSISLSSGRPVEKKDMLYVLESALSANNLVMVRNASGYRIAPANEGGSRSGRPVGRRGGARIWPDRDPAAICLRNDAVETPRRLRYASRRHSNRSERQATDRGGNWKRSPVGR